MILRVSVGSLLVAQGILSIPWHGPASLCLITGGVLLVTGACILAGFLTPILGILAVLECVAIAFLWFPLPPAALLDSKPLILYLIATAAAICLLGPGAYSLDARLFGWREIVIPPASSKPED